MSKEEIIKELNVCGFKDQSVLAALDTMAKGALWMQEKMIDKACEWLSCYGDDARWENAQDKIKEFRRAMEE